VGTIARVGVGVTSVSTTDWSPSSKIDAMVGVTTLVIVSSRVLTIVSSSLNEVVRYVKVV